MAKKPPETNFEPGSRPQGGGKVPETKAGAKKANLVANIALVGGGGGVFFFSWGGGGGNQLLLLQVIIIGGNRDSSNYYDLK